MGFLRKLRGEFVGGEDPNWKDPDYSESLKAVENELAHLEGPKAQYLACLALLLGRVAHADFEISENEKSRMLSILKDDVHLDDSQANIVAALAIEQTLLNGLEHHIVVKRMCELTERNQRHDVVRALLHLAAEDDITGVEDKEIRIIAQGLRISNEDYLQLRSEFREHLAALKNLPG